MVIWTIEPGLAGVLAPPLGAGVGAPRVSGPWKENGEIGNWILYLYYIIIILKYYGYAPFHSKYIHPGFCVFKGTLVEKENTFNWIHTNVLDENNFRIRKWNVYTTKKMISRKKYFYNPLCQKAKHFSEKTKRCGKKIRFIGNRAINF